MTQTITRLFDSHDTGLRAALALKNAGFTERDLGILVNRDSPRGREPDAASALGDAGSGAILGGALGGAAGLLAGTGVVAIPGIGPVMAIGWLASTLAVGAAGAVAGGVAGGIIGALAGTGSDSEIEVYAESIRRGDTLLTVRVPEDRVLEVTRILAAFPAVTPESRAAEYRAEGWERFDATASGPVKPDDDPRVGRETARSRELPRTSA